MPMKTTNIEDNFESPDDISDEELLMLNERVEEYQKDPSKGKDLKEVERLLKSK